MGPEGVRVVTAHGRRCDSNGSCLEEEEWVYAIEILRMGVDCFTSLPVI